MRFDERAADRVGTDTLTTGVLRRESNGAALPALLWSRGPANGMAVWVSPEGKSSLRSASGRLARPVERLLAAGYDVLAIDVLGQGELRIPGIDPGKVRLASERAHAGFTFGYNLPMPAERVQDVLTAIRFARARAGNSGRVILIGSGPAAAWAAGARALAGEDVTRGVFDLAAFRFGAVDRIDSPDFLPGAAKYGDVPALLALSAPGESWLRAGAARDLAIVRQAYTAPHAAARLTLAARSATLDDGVAWAAR